jgi:hypothetical protein
MVHLSGGSDFLASNFPYKIQIDNFYRVHINHLQTTKMLCSVSLVGSARELLDFFA